LPISSNGLGLPAGFTETHHQALVEGLDQVIDLDALEVTVQGLVPQSLLFLESA